MKKIESSNTLTIDESTKTINNFRNTFFRMNAKPDSITRTYSKPIKVNLEVINDLNDKIREKLRMHCQEESCMTRITINFSNHRSCDFNNWIQFNQTTFSTSNSIESITMKWNFLVDMPQYDSPQPHCLVVKISSGLKIADFFSLMASGKIEDADDINILNNTVVARIEFINTLLGEEVLNVVSDWVDNCARNNYKSNRLLLFLKKYRNIAATLVENVTNIFGISLVFLLLYRFVSYYANKANSTTEIFSKFILVVGASYIFVYLCKRISRIIAKKTYENLQVYGEGFIFEITSGDKQQIKYTKELNHKTAIQITMKLIFSFIFDLICTVIITFILK